MSTRVKLNLVKKELYAQTLDWVQNENPNTAFTYPLSVEIFSNAQMEKTEVGDNFDTSKEYPYPANILVLQVSGTQFDPNQGDMFVKVADVVDLYELPTKQKMDFMNTKSTTLATPFYRTNKFTLCCRSIEEANTVWQILQQEAKAFIDNYNIAHNTTLSTTTSIEL